MDVADWPGSQHDKAHSADDRCHGCMLACGSASRAALQCVSTILRSRRPSRSLTGRSCAQPRRAHQQMRSPLIEAALCTSEHVVEHGTLSLSHLCGSRCLACHSCRPATPRVAHRPPEHAKDGTSASFRSAKLARAAASPGALPCRPLCHATPGRAQCADEPRAEAVCVGNQTLNISW